MTRNRNHGSWILALCVGAMSWTVAGCPPPPVTNDAGPSDECEVPRDCGAGSDCVMGADGYRICIKLFCTTDTDCNVAAGEHCDQRRGLCLGDTCRDNNQCQGGNVCLGGSCQAAPPGADSCQISPAAAVVRGGATANLGVTGFLNSGALAALATFTWSSSDDSCVTVSSAGVANGAGASTCTATLTATPVGGGTACTATVTNFPAVTLPTLRALVLEEFAGTPVQGAKLLVRTDDGAGGAVTVLTTVDTDAQGVATIADVGVTQASHLLDASIFHQGYHYMTVVRPGSSDLAFFLRKVPDATKMAGVKGTFDFSQVHTRGDISLGIAGMSIPGSLTDLDFMLLLGETVPRDINLEGVGNFEDVPLPSGLFMKVGAADIKADFQAFGEPGKRILWGLGGKVRLAEIGPIISEVAGGSGELDIGGILAAVLPYFGTFDHAVAGNIDLPLVNRPTTGEPGNWDFGTDSQTLGIDTLLSQSAAYTIPTLPRSPVSDAFIDGAIVLMGVIVPGQGTVPLGLTAGLDAPEDTDVADGVVDPTPCPENNPGCVRPPRGQVIVDFAPPHSGMEGSPYITMVMALGLDAIGEAQFTSILVNIADSVSGSGANTFAAGAFLPVISGATYVRGLSFAQNANVTGADFYRLHLDAADKGWDIYFDDAVAGLSLPTPPTGMEARNNNADVQVFKTFSGSIGVRELFEFNGTNVSDLLYLTAGFSTMECTTIEQPQQGNCNADDGYTLDAASGLCVGGPSDITAFGAGTASPCSGQTGYEPVFTAGAGSAGICARTPSCRQEN